MKQIFFVALFLIACFAYQSSAEAMATVSGRVVNASNGQPIAGATIRAVHSGQTRFSTTTDANGFYQFSNIQPRYYTIIATAPGFQQKATGVKPPNKQTSTVNFRLGPTGASVNGTVTDATTSNPISGASVSIYQQQTLVATTTTNASGTYLVSNLLAPNSYTVTVSASGYQTKSQGVILPVGSSKTANFSLDQNPGALGGQVRDSSTNLPVSQATVLVYLGQVLVATKDTDASGNYSIPDLPPGFYTVRVQALNYQAKLSGATIDSGVTTSLDFLIGPLPGNIKGVVKDAQTGNALVGASVLVFQGSTLIGTVLTDPLGQYELDQLAPGNYTLTTSFSGYQTKSVGAKVSANSTTTENIFLSQNPGKITGQITDAITTLPIPGAQVLAYSGNTVVGQAVTDSSGNYVIDNLSPGGFSVFAVATDYQTKGIGASVSAGGTTVASLALDPNSGSISGLITDSLTMIPISGAKVLIYQGNTLVDTLITDSSGHYSSSNLAPGQYQVVGQATNYQSNASGALVSAGLGTIVDVSLAPDPGTVEGTVKDSITMHPISGANVQIFKGQTLVGSSVTDSSGNYQVGGLAPGSYTVNFSAQNYQTKILGASVTSNSKTELDANLDPNPGCLQGLITDSVTSNPLVGATVSIYQSNTFVEQVFTDASGNYTFSKLQPGTYLIVASAVDYQLTLGAGLVTSNSKTTVDLALTPTPGDLNGNITDSLTSTPIIGAEVQIFNGTVLVGSALTDNLGNYTIGNLPPGQYTVTATANNYQGKSVGAIISSGASTTVDFSLDPNPGQIEGMITDSTDGKPIAGAFVLVYMGNTVVGRAVTDATGNYQIQNLAPGQYTVIASAANYHTKFVGVSVSSSATASADLKLDPDPGSISGSVTDAFSLPLSGVVIELRKGPLLIASTITDPNGNYTFTNLPPDNYLLIATLTNYQSATNTANVVSNTNTVVDFSLTLDPGTLGGTVTSAASGNPPIPGATIEVYQGQTQVASVITDPLGNYTVPNLAPGMYTVVATASGFQGVSTTVTINPNATTSYSPQLDLDPGSVIGTVTNLCTLTGEPGVLVIASIGSTIYGYSVTDSQGQYIISTLAPGTYTITAIGANFVDEQKQAVVTADNSTTVDFDLTPKPLPPSSIMGNVVENRYLTETSIVHAIKWTASRGECIELYRIFRNGQLIGTVNSNSQLEFFDHCRKGMTDTYSVVAVNSFGLESDPISITLSP